MRCTWCNRQVSTVWGHEDLAGVELCAECLLEMMAKTYPEIKKLD